MKFSLFNHKADNVPRQVERSLKQLRQRLAKPGLRPAKDGLLLSPAVFEGSRKNENVLELSAIVLDLDHGVPALGEICKKMRRTGCAFAVYSTHSHLRTTESNPKGERRYRVMVPLKSPVPAADHEALRRSIIEMTGLPADPAASALAQMYYAPAKASADAPYEYHVEDGDFLDWTKLHLSKTEPLKAPPDVDSSQSNGRVNKSDDELLSIMFSKSPAAERLYRGDWSGYRSQSEADLAFTNHVSSYFKDPDRIERVFRGSKLWRGKCDEKHGTTTYARMTIAKALQGRTEFYGNGNGHSPATLPAREKEDQWEPLATFYEHSRPGFPVDVLPEPFRSYVQGLARSIQVPVGLPAMLSLTVAAGAVAGHVRVQARRDWVEPTNLFTLSVLPPGHRKSAAFQKICEPVEEAERDLVFAKRDEIARAASEFRMLEERKSKLEKDASRADNPEDRKAKSEEAIAVAQQLASMRVPVTPRLIVSDATSEVLTTLLAEQGGRMSMFSTEGGPFETMAGRYNNSTPNFDVFLKGHSGDTLRVDRRGRSEFVERPALTVGCTVQPDVIRGFVAKPGFRGLGLLARFLYCLPESTVGRRQVDPQPLSEHDTENFRRTIRALAGIDPLMDRNGLSVPRMLYLTAEANNLLKTFERELEPKLSDDGELGSIADWAGKLAGAVVRLAGVLWLIENADSLLPWPEKISADTMKRAIELGRYLTEHARAAFAEMGANEQVENAKRLLRWIEKTGALSFSRREAHQAHRARFKTVDEIDPALDLLESHSCIRAQIDNVDRRPGRKASQAYDVNPFLFSESAKRSCAVTDDSEALPDDLVIPASVQNSVEAISACVDSQRERGTA